MASYCAVVRRYSTSKHGIVISQYQNALVRVNPKTLLLQIVWLLISNLKGKEGWVLGTSLTSGRLVHQMPCLLVLFLRNSTPSAKRFCALVPCRIGVNFSAQLKICRTVFDVIFRGDHLYPVLHKLPEKRKEVSFAAADMAHPADIHSVNIAFADMPQHLSVSGAQQPAAMRIGAAAHNNAAISMSL